MSRLDAKNPPGYSDGRRGVPAWALSAVLHFVVVLLAALVIQPLQKGGPAAEPDRVAGIALVKNRQQKTEYFTEEDADESRQSASSASAIEKALPNLNQLSEELPGFLPSELDLGAIGAEIGEKLEGADGFLEGIAKGPKRGGDTGQTSTEVFGIRGTGTRFVYVFDRSGSMVGFGGRPLLAAKQQLLASLESLGPKQQFQIIFYNERPRAFTPRGERPRLLYATEENRKAAKKFIVGIPGGGATRHLPALKMAVDFGPDVVFFLTDAAEPVISDEELRVIDRWNRNAATIHAIEFGPQATPSADNFLKKLSRFNGGNYVYKNVTLFENK